MTIENHWNQWLNDPKTIESNGLGAENQLMVMVEWPKNHWKTIESNGLEAENQLMVMVEWPQKNITIPSLPKNDHCSPLTSIQTIVTDTQKVQPTRPKINQLYAGSKPLQSPHIPKPENMDRRYSQKPRSRTFLQYQKVSYRIFNRVSLIHF